VWDGVTGVAIDDAIEDILVGVSSHVTCGSVAVTGSAGVGMAL